MTRREIEKLIKKLSRRRHWETKDLLYYMRYPNTNRSEISARRAIISDLTDEISALMERLRKEHQ